MRISTRHTVMLFSVAMFTACSPIKGYPGPDRPDEELAIVYLDDCDSAPGSQSASVNGITFGSSGVSLLPGKYTFNASFEAGSSPYGCVSEERIDHYGYDSCIQEREDDLRDEKKRNSPRTCSLSSYTSTVYHCYRDYAAFTCEVRGDLWANTKSDLCTAGDVNSGTATLTARGGRQLDRVQCALQTRFSRNEELSSPY